MAKTIAIPEELLRELYVGLGKVEEVLATLEELMDKEGLKRIRKAEKEYREGEFETVRNSDEIKRLLSE